MIFTSPHISKSMITAPTKADTTQPQPELKVSLLKMKNRATAMMAPTANEPVAKVGVIGLASKGIPLKTNHPISSKAGIA